MLYYDYYLLLWMPKFDSLQIDKLVKSSKKFVVIVPFSPNSLTHSSLRNSSYAMLWIEKSWHFIWHKIFMWLTLAYISDHASQIAADFRSIMQIILSKSHFHFNSLEFKSWVETNSTLKKFDSNWSARSTHDIGK